MRIHMLAGAVASLMTLPAAGQSGSAYGYQDPYASPYNPGHGGGAVAPSTIPGQQGAGTAVPQVQAAPRSYRPPSPQTQGSIGWGQPETSWPSSSSAAYPPDYPSSYPSPYPSGIEPAYPEDPAYPPSAYPAPADRGLPQSTVPAAASPGATERRSLPRERIRRADAAVLP